MIEDKAPQGGDQKTLEIEIEFGLNGKHFTSTIHTTTLLLDLIRSSGLTGTKEGCGVGVCGACTVLIDDLPVSSCIYLAACVGGADVWTIEGLAHRFPNVVTAFVEHEGMQCGICTPGQVASVCAMSVSKVDSEAGIREYMNGNLCRCTGYSTIVAAAREVLGLA